MERPIFINIDDDIKIKSSKFRKEIRMPFVSSLFKTPSTLICVKLNSDYVKTAIVESNHKFGIMKSYYVFHW